MYPCNYNVSSACYCYLHIIIVATGFTITPTDLVVAVRIEAKFFCQHPLADAIGWRFNGTTILGSTLNGVTTMTTSVPGVVLNVLTILSALPHYNQTEVECVAYFDDSPTMHSDVVNLTIQGVKEINLIINYMYMYLYPT